MREEPVNNKMKASKNPLMHEKPLISFKFETPEGGNQLLLTLSDLVHIPIELAIMCQGPISRPDLS